jgi:hypothetical protein
MYSYLTPEALQPLEFVPFNEGPWYSAALTLPILERGLREPRPAFHWDTNVPGLNT